MNPVLRPALLFVALSLFAAGHAGAAEARRTAPIVLAQLSDDDQNGGGAVDPQGSTAALTVRMDRLEGTIRSLTGKVEELQFQNRKLADDLRKMQQDVDFRFQDLGRSGAVGGAPPARPAPAKRGDLDAPAAGASGLAGDSSGVAPSTTTTTAAAEPPLRPTRRAGDAFDPDANPTAPGAPRPLGAVAPSAPLDLMKRQATPSIIDQSTENGVAAVPAGAIAPDAPPARPAANPNAVASLVPGGTRDEFNGDLDLYKQGQYDSAASGLKGFLDKYPRDRMVPDAVYLLGETYTKLGRHREAAEQFLRLSTDFSKAPRAPDALLRLGMSLNAMGVREQACATYQEVTRRYPAASTDVKTALDRELKRAHC